MIKAGFPQSCKPDLRTHWNVSRSHRTMSIIENGLLWSVWEMVSVFGHWVEHFWEASVIQCAQESLRYFTKGQQAFCVQLSYQWQYICLDASCSANEHTGLLIAQMIQCFKFISTRNLRLTAELILKAIAKIRVNYCDLIVVVLHSSMYCSGAFAVS